MRNPNGVPSSPSARARCSTAATAASVSIGDEVYYGKYSGTEIDFGADKYVVIRESDLLAIVDE